jgi:ABC-type transport system involved in multi-copper enzyme maturation permease subunit
VFPNLPQSLSGSFSLNILLAAPSVWSQYAPGIVASVLVIAGLAAFGFDDVLRLHWRRIWAISGVCVTESLRRRVLWVTPMAVLGVIVISQLNQPLDAQDAIRQTTKFCLFASAMLVTITAVILACTNLPREIENRVIFTIVTKPTTRLEIVIGKVLGFARVSGVIIVIMGVFTLAYLQFRTWRMVSQLKAQLAAEPENSPLRPMLAHYVSSGLLGTRSIEWAKDVQVFARPPQGDMRWMAGGEGQYFIVPFELTQADKELLASATNGGKVFVTTTLLVEQHKPDEGEQRLIKDMGLLKSKTSNVLGPAAPTTAPAGMTAPPPQVAFRLLDENHRALSGSADMGVGQVVDLKAPEKPGMPFRGDLEISPDMVARVTGAGRFYVQVNARTPATLYGANDRPVFLYIPGAAAPILPPADPTNASRVALPTFYSFPGRGGMRLTGRADGAGPVAAFRFRNVPVETGSKTGAVALQMNVTIDKTGDFDASTGSLSRASVEVLNSATGESSGQIEVSPETSRVAPVDVPAKYVAGGNFDVLLRGLTPGQWLGVQNESLSLVTADRSFVFNLIKSLFILWLLSLLVVIISVFCSTFLSWPIAVVLTLLILLGHWGVDQLGDALKPGGGRNTALEFQFQDVSQTIIVSKGVEGLSSMLRFISAFLPDVAKFPVMEDIERGVSIPPQKVASSLGVVLCYGLPMLVFSYVIFRKKEVAP